MSEEKNEASTENNAKKAEDIVVELTNEEKKNKIDQQTIYYPQNEQVDLTTYSEDVDRIDLSINRLKSIDNFSRFTNLLAICFRSNLLKTFRDDNLKVELGLSKIQELDFYDNQIETIENLNQFTTLEILDLSFNRFKKIENLDLLINLKKLYLVHNHITKIENLENLINLEVLELGDNQLRSIENIGTLQKLTQL